MRASVVLALLLVASVANAETFRDKQLAYPRVKKAFENKGATVRALFEQNQVPWPPAGLLIRVFKHEKVLELWGAEKKNGPYRKLKDYAVCATSGELGPKRREGDLQIPEGFYFVSIFNPVSNFHLSLGVSYPNESDRILGRKGKLGGAIMIHGDCVTIGCVPITDEYIEEVYVAAVEAHANGQQRIPIQIFPSRLDEAGMKQLSELAGGDEKLLGFWRELKAGHDLFERERVPPKVAVDKEGRYRFATGVKGARAQPARGRAH